MTTPKTSGDVVWDLSKTDWSEVHILPGALEAPIFHKMKVKPLSEVERCPEEKSFDLPGPWMGISSPIP